MKKTTVDEKKVANRLEGKPTTMEGMLEYIEKHSEEYTITRERIKHGREATRKYTLTVKAVLMKQHIDLKYISYDNVSACLLDCVDWLWAIHER